MSDVVARVYDTYLHKPEVEAFIPQGTSTEDSILMANNYIGNWVSQHLMLHLAGANLSDSVRAIINKQVSEYRSSLLIHHYKKEYINKKLVVNVSDEEIEAYYNVNKENFLLPTSIIKAHFIILPQNGENDKTVKEIKKLLKSKNSDDIAKLEEMSVMVAKRYDNFDTAWVEINHILNLIPGDVNELERTINRPQIIEKSDNENIYILRIDKFKEKQTIAPLDYVFDEIRLIIENQHKLNFEYEFEKQINQDSRENGNVTIY